MTFLTVEEYIIDDTRMVQDFIKREIARKKKAGRAYTFFSQLEAESFACPVWARRFIRVAGSRLEANCRRCFTLKGKCYWKRLGEEIEFTRARFISNGVFCPECKFFRLVPGELRCFHCELEHSKE